MHNNDLNFLIVEDEFIAYEYLKDILHSMNLLNIFHATNSEDALEIIKNNKIDLCFMDINIKGNIDGINCANLLNNEYFIPIIYTTAHADTHTIAEAKETNVYGYIVKPFNIEEVEATLNIAIKIISVMDIKASTINQDIKDTSDIVILSQNYSYDLTKQTFYANNQTPKITKKELKLLDLLCKNINQNISYETIKEELWERQDISASTLRDTIFRLKNKFPELDLQNISNFGYVLKKNF